MLTVAILARPHTAGLPVKINTAARVLCMQGTAGGLQSGQHGGVLPGAATFMPGSVRLINSILAFAWCFAGQHYLQTHDRQSSRWLRVELFRNGGSRTGRQVAPCDVVDMSAPAPGSA